MSSEIAEASFPAALAEYASVSMAFEVTDVLDVSGGDRIGDRFTLTERRLSVPYVKDYDAVALFRAAVRWALSKGCRELKVETQNINVPACRFYERMGCRLRTVNRGAYPDLPHEIQLLWYKVLAPREAALG